MTCRTLSWRLATNLRNTVYPLLKHNFKLHGVGSYGQWTMQWNNRYRHSGGTIADASCDEIRYVIAVAQIASTHDDVALRARSHMAGYCSGKSVKFYGRDIRFETWPRLPVMLAEVFHCFPQSFQAILRSISFRPRTLPSPSLPFHHLSAVVTAHYVV